MGKGRYTNPERSRKCSPLALPPRACPRTPTGTPAGTPARRRLQFRGSSSRALRLARSPSDRIGGLPGKSLLRRQLYPRTYRVSRVSQVIEAWRQAANYQPTSVVTSVASSSEKKSNPARALEGPMKQLTLRSCLKRGDIHNGGVNKKTVKKN